MMHLLVLLIRMLNAIASALGGILLAPIARLPGWLSLTVISILLGIILLVIYKHTSNQKAIARVRNDIQANLLAIRLFKDCSQIPLKAQSGLFCSSFKLLILSLRPMLMMLIPVTLILAQLAGWFQVRPVRVGDDIIVQLELNKELDTFPRVQLQSPSAIDTVTGPVVIQSRKEMVWKLNAVDEGGYVLIFQVDDQTFKKEIIVGNGRLRVSPERPSQNLSDMILYPLERPFDADCPVQSIRIDYPPYSSRIVGSEGWIIYLFAVSTIAALLFKSVFNVKL
jgi:uncharacterized membrane protein (DUF106 family)